MSDSPRRAGIICYGHDEMLLRTRQQLLMTIGLPVCTARDAPSFRAAVLNLRPALILLCQSLSGEECSSAAEYARQQSPGSKVLLVYNQPEGCHLVQEHTEFYSRNGPAALIETVRGLVGGDLVRRGQNCTSGVRPIG